jgi:hypothetical protein
VKWVTRENANVDRVACPWLIRRFIDPDAEFLFTARDQVLEVARREGAHSYDAPGAEYTHRDGKCSFDVLVEDYQLGADPALVRMAEVVHAADVSEDRDSSPEGSRWRRRCTTRCTPGARRKPPDDQPRRTRGAGRAGQGPVSGAGPDRVHPGPARSPAGFDHAGVYRGAAGAGRLYVAHTGADTGWT